MGWNDHVDFIEMECDACHEMDTWEFWNEVALARYSGRMGELIGRDATKSGKCPHCGSDKGIPVEEGTMPDMGDWERD